MTKTIAIVSGKGGSGKTMVAATMGRVLATNHMPTTLIDGDIATGGLTFYLGLKLVRNTSVGLSDAIYYTNGKLNTEEIRIQTVGATNSPLTFIGIGNHKRLFEIKHDIDYQKTLNNIFKSLESFSEYAIIDCRGGIDESSLQICSMVDEILIVTETDTTAFQATQYLVEVLAKQGLAHKLRGFFLNKVFDDPTYLAREGTAYFKCQFLTAIPFDLRATRSFLTGELPSLETLFTNQICHGLHKLLPDTSFTIRDPLEFSDFRNIDLATKRAGLSRRLFSILLMYTMMAYLWINFRDLLNNWVTTLFFMVSSIIGLMAASDKIALAVTDSIFPKSKKN